LQLLGVASRVLSALGSDDGTNAEVLRTRSLQNLGRSHLLAPFTHRQLEGLNKFVIAVLQRKKTCWCWIQRAPQVPGYVFVHTVKHGRRHTRAFNAAAAVPFSVNRFS
jgi:hypothetical protein